MRGLLVRPQSLNRYAYIENTPVSFSDELGYVIKIMRAGDTGGSNAAVQRAAARAQAGAYVSGLNAKARAANSSSSPRGPGGAPVRPMKTPAGRTPGFTSAVHDALQGCGYTYDPCGPSQPNVTPVPKPRPINCQTDMKVGMNPAQVAINEACGRAFAEARIQTQPQWAQDWWNASQGIDRILRPAVPLLTVGVGIGIGGTGAASGTRVPVGASATQTASSVRGAVSGLPAGNSKGVGTVTSEAELANLFNRISAGGTTVPSGTYPGTFKMLPDGTRIGYRSESKSGLATIDITFSDGNKFKIHVAK